MQTAHAQTEKGKMLVGGSLSFRGTSSENIDSLSTSEYSNSYLNFNPKIGYFISDNFALGLGINFGFYNTNSDQNDKNVKTHSETQNKNFGFGIFSKNYFDISSNIKCYILSELQYIQFKDEYSNNTSIEYTENIYRFSVSPGVSYFINSHFAIEANLGLLFYENSKSTKSNQTSPYSYTKNNYGINLSTSSFSLGVNYHF